MTLFFSIFAHRVNNSEMNKLRTLWAYLSKYKYLAVVILGLLIVGIIDENSFLHRYSRRAHNDALRSEIETYKGQYERDTKKLEGMQRDIYQVEKLARERYFMKRDNEDVYVIRSEEGVADSCIVESGKSANGR